MDDTAKPTTLLAIQLPGESVDHVPVRAFTLWLHFSSGDKKTIENARLVGPGSLADELP